MKRAKQRGLERNAAVVLGNVSAPHDVEVLTRALDDAEPLVREHAAWALGAIACRSATATCCAESLDATGSGHRG